MIQHNFHSIAILMGGWSHERDVSLDTGKAFERCLSQKTRYKLSMIDVTKDLSHLLRHLEESKPDVVINALHGTGGEDGVIQSILTILGIPYTHSNVLSSAIAMDKVISKKLFQSDQIPIAPYCLFSLEAYKNSLVVPFPFPYVIKPVAEGSSRGVFIISSEDDKQKALSQWIYGDELIAEMYIKGREIQVAVINGKAIGAIELKPHTGFYDYEAKYTEGKTTHIMPAPLSREDEQAIFSYAEQAYKTLRCSGITRADFRLDETQEAPYRIAMLEMNTQPGMTSLSLVPEIAAYYGTSFDELIEIMLNSAIMPPPKASSSF